MSISNLILQPSKVSAGSSRKETSKETSRSFGEVPSHTLRSLERYSPCHHGYDDVCSQHQVRPRPGFDVAEPPSARMRRLSRDGKTTLRPEKADPDGKRVAAVVGSENAPAATRSTDQDGSRALRCYANEPTDPSRPFLSPLTPRDPLQTTRD